MKQAAENQHQEASGQIITSLSVADLTKKVADLDDTVRELEKSLTERHLAQITRIFGITTGLIGLFALLVTVAITVLGWMARSDTKDASKKMDDAGKEMKSEVKQAISDMNQKFEMLAGETLKKPRLEILYEGHPLDGRAFEIPQSSGALRLGTIFLHNSGNKRIEYITTRLYATRGITLNGDWQAFTSPDTNWPVAYILLGTRGIGIDAKETFSFDEAGWINLSFPITNGACKLDIYYGVEQPAEAKFDVRVKP